MLQIVTKQHHILKKQTKKQNIAPNELDQVSHVELFF